MSHDASWAPGLGPPWYAGTAAFALVLVLAHLLAPRIRGRLAGREPIVASLGGGLAAGYAFLHLIPEVHRGHALLGRMIFAVPLIGFILVYGARRLADRRAGDDSTGFSIALTHLWIYNGLLVYGAPETAIEVGWRAAGIVLALALHLIHLDFSFGAKQPERFDSWGRYVLALAPMVGYVSVVLGGRVNETAHGVVIAFLAGGVLFNVFREEIPREAESRFGWFVLGVAAFSIFVVISS